jgi:hypothetical protein
VPNQESGGKMALFPSTSVISFEAVRAFDLKLRLDADKLIGRNIIIEKLDVDVELANELKRGRKFSLYRCKNGMTDTASPIVIEGQHVANAFVGQFFLSRPDKAYFRRQAAEFGFDGQAYLNALDEVAVVSEKKIAPIMNFLSPV